MASFSRGQASLIQQSMQNPNNMVTSELNVPIIVHSNDSTEEDEMDGSQSLPRRVSLFSSLMSFRCNRNNRTDECSPPVGSSSRYRLENYSKKIFGQFRSRSQSMNVGNSLAATGSQDASAKSEMVISGGSCLVADSQRRFSMSSNSSSKTNSRRPTLTLTKDKSESIRPCTPTVFSDALYTGLRRMTDSGRKDTPQLPVKGNGCPVVGCYSGPAGQNRIRRLSEPVTTVLRTRGFPTSFGMFDVDSSSFVRNLKNSSQLDDYKVLGLYAEKTQHSPRYYLLESRERIYTQFIKSHRCYDLIPTSSKLVVFDTELSVKKAFFALVYNSVRAAPLWESNSRRFVGMLTITDFITILHKCYNTGQENNIRGLEEHRICSWREELMTSGTLQPLCTVSVTASLLDAVRLLCDKKVHRLPVVDRATGNILYILTHKRILRFLYLYMNELPSPSYVSKSPKQLGIGTWSNIHTVNKSTRLIEVLRKFLELRVSALPVVDDDNRVVDIYAKFDVINLAADNAYNNLDVTVSEALKHRSAWFEGVHSCTEDDSLKVYIDTLAKSEVHRLVVVDSEKRVKGMVSLSDILAYIVLRPQGADEPSTPLAAKQQTADMIGGV